MRSPRHRDTRLASDNSRPRPGRRRPHSRRGELRSSPPHFSLSGTAPLVAGTQNQLPAAVLLVGYPRLVRFSFPHEPLRRSARARHPRGGKVRSVFQTFVGGATRILNRPERPRSSSVKRVDSALWRRCRHCWRDYVDSREVNGHACENDTYSVVFRLAMRRCNSRDSRTAAAAERRYTWNERGNTRRRNSAADRHIVACQGRDLAAD